MEILLIGGTNFIGPVLTEQLIQTGHDVSLFHRNLTPGVPHKQIQGDCNNVNDLNRAIEAVEPDVIIHMIALFESHIQILEQALQGKKTRSIILSSLDVYKAYEVFCRLSNAPVVPVPLTEQSPLRDVLYPYRDRFDADFAHDYEKILVEKAAIESPVIDAIVLRLGMVYGRNDPNHRFLEPIQKMSQGDRQIKLAKDLANCRMSKCCVGNVAQGIRLAAEKGLPGEIYNLAAQEVLTELEWYQQIAKLMKLEVDIVISQVSPSSGGFNLSQDLIVDTSKIRKQLGYRELFSIQEGLLDTIQWEFERMG